jgi:branched-chain amino acid transport system substrate-binding protein
VKWLFPLLVVLPLLSGQERRPYFDFSKAGAGFYGSGEDEAELAGLDGFRIGVLGPATGLASVQLRTGVQLGIEAANARRKPGLPPYSMAYRADDGPWGVAASQVVSLAYEDRVRAIIGGLDGQKTHLAELVVSKAWVPVVSPTAPDCTVDYANVPWVFRCAPSDGRQADILLDYAGRRGWSRVVVLSETDRESYTGFRRLRERMDRRRVPPVAHLQFSQESVPECVRELGNHRFDAIVVWGRLDAAAMAIASIRAAGVQSAVLVPGTVAEPSLAADASTLGEVYGAALCDLSRSDPARQEFRRLFLKSAGTEPGALAFYAYDAATLVTRTIDAVGPARARIREGLTHSYLDGVAGPIKFDSLRGNPSDPVLMKLGRSGWQRVE